MKLSQDCVRYVLLYIEERTGHSTKVIKAIYSHMDDGTNDKIVQALDELD